MMMASVKPPCRTRKSAQKFAVVERLSLASVPCVGVSDGCESYCKYIYRCSVPLVAVTDVHPTAYLFLQDTTLLF